MTNIVKLPPEFISGNEIPVSVATIKRERMEEILREAVEADRQQRGEPFMYLRTLNGKPDWSEDCVADCESDLIHDEEMYAEGYGVMPLYTDPQPTAPALDAISSAVGAMELALDSHGKTLLTNPPQEAWKYHNVSQRLRDGVSGLTGITAPAQEPSDEELISWAGEEQFFLFCDQDEFLDIARALLARYGSKS